MEQSPSLKSLKIMEDCDKTYYESYTSPIIRENVFGELSQALSDSKVEVVKREFVEDGRVILDAAKDSTIALVCAGDPMVATTHQELRTRAIKLGIQTRVIHGSSIISCRWRRTRPPLLQLREDCHNDERTDAVHRLQHDIQKPAPRTTLDNTSGVERVYRILPRTSKSGQEPSGSRSRSSKRNTSEGIRFFLWSQGWELTMCISRLFHSTKYSRQYLGKPPHALVIPGKLHFTEREALSALFSKSAESFHDNSEKITKTSRRWFRNIPQKTMKALERAKTAAANKEFNRFADVFENVECYMRDAERFLMKVKKSLQSLALDTRKDSLDSLRFGWSARIRVVMRIIKEVH